VTSTRISKRLEELQHALFVGCIVRLGCFILLMIFYYKLIFFLLKNKILQTTCYEEVP